MLHRVITESAENLLARNHCYTHIILISFLGLSFFYVTFLDPTMFFHVGISYFGYSNRLFDNV